MSTNRNAASARPGHSTMAPQPRSSSGINSNVRIGTSGGPNPIPPPPQVQEDQSASWYHAPQQESHHRPDYVRFSTAPIPAPRVAPPPLDSRSQSDPGPARYPPFPPAHLVNLPTNPPGWSQSDNVSGSAISDSFNNQPTNIRGSTISQTTRHSNDRHTLHIQNLNIYMTHVSPSMSSVPLGNSNPPTTGTPTTYPHETRGIYSQASIPGAEAHLDPVHYAAPPSNVQQQPISSVPGQGWGGVPQVHGPHREQRPMGNVPNNLGGPSTRVDGTGRANDAPLFGNQGYPPTPSIPRPEDVPPSRRAEHLETNPFRGQNLFEANGAGHPTGSMTRAELSFQSDPARRPTRPLDFRKSSTRDELSATDGAGDNPQTGPPLNGFEGPYMDRSVGMNRRRQGHTMLNNSPLLHDRLLEVKEAQSNGTLERNRKSSPSSEAESFLSSGSSTVKESLSMSSSQVLERSPDHRSRNLDTVDETTSTDSDYEEDGDDEEEDDDDYDDDDDDDDDEDGAPVAPSSISSSSHPSSSNGRSVNSNLDSIPEGQPVAKQPPRNIEPLGNPRLTPFKNEKGDEWILKPTIGKHIPPYMCSSILYDGLETIHQLWDPRPSLTGADGRKQGIEVGDLVYLNDFGEVRVLFNILHTREENIARGATPPSEPFHSLDPQDSVKVLDIQKQKFFVSKNMKRVNTNKSFKYNNTRYEFATLKKGGDNGAIVVLPDGGSEVSLREPFFQQPRVKRHFRDHAPCWYQHAKTGPLPNLENGSLYLVRKAYCARTCGIAAFVCKDYPKDPITAIFQQHGPHEYRWETRDNRLQTGVYPSSFELKELQGREPPLNQCIGVLLSSLRLDDRTWQMHFAMKLNPTTPEKTSPYSTTRITSRSSSELSNGSRSSLSERFSRFISNSRRSLKGKGKERAASSYRDWEGDNAEYRDHPLLILEET